MLLKKLINLRVPTEKAVPLTARIYAILCQYYGYEITPVTAFGIGTGISFEYIRKPGYRITPDFGAEDVFFDGQFSKDKRRLARILRIWLDVYRNDSKEKAYQSYSNMLSQGIPVIAEVDLDRYVSFLKKHGPDIREWNDVFAIPPGFYLNGYQVIIAGIDEAGDFICLDANLGEAIRIPTDAFMDMHSSRDAYINTEYEWTDILVPKHKKLNTLHHAILEGIQDDMQRLLFPAVFDGDYVVGLAGMRSLLEDMRRGDFSAGCRRPDAAVWKIYYCSEVLNGETGLYRNTYADFLSESAFVIPALEGPAADYRRLGAGWSHFLKALFETGGVRAEETGLAEELEGLIELETGVCKGLELLVQREIRKGRRPGKGSGLG